MAKQRLGTVAGVSTTGAAHDLLFEVSGDGRLMVTVMGADGRKRHASAIVDAAALATAAAAAAATIGGGAA